MYSENLSVLSSIDPMTISGVKPVFQGMNGQISQIPGLSPTISALPDDRARGRRAGVLESDSDYIKLAKQGGHKGLLWHEETIASKLAPCNPPDCDCSTSEDHEEPSLINSEEKKHPGAFLPAQPPFGTDNMSAWERDDSSSNGKEKNNSVHYSPKEKRQLSDQYQGNSKFKKIIFDKNPSPVNMSKLLSFGYVEDNKDKVDLSN